jgi:starch phosphorylase
VRDTLKVVFLPNYCVSQAERVIPATELSEQISMAGMEASGTGNMKFALNGALTIGTLDGANVEILHEVGEENFFLFGHTAEELRTLRQGGYDPAGLVRADQELAEVLGLLSSGVFAKGDRQLYDPIRQSLLEYGDPFFVLADYRAYLDAQERASEAYRERDQWTRRAILNTANMGLFSSDRAVAQYAREIWNTQVCVPGEENT